MGYTELLRYGDYTLVEYKSEYYVLDKNYEPIRILSNDKQDWKEFIREISTQENSVATSLKNNTVMTQKTIKVKELKNKYPNYTGVGYIITNGKSYYTGGKDYSPYFNGDVVVFTDLSYLKRTLTYLTSDFYKEDIRINRGRVVF